MGIHGKMVNTMGIVLHINFSWDLIVKKLTAIQLRGLVKEKGKGKLLIFNWKKKRSIYFHLNLDIWQLSMLLGHCSFVFPIPFLEKKIIL